MEEWTTETLWVLGFDVRASSRVFTADAAGRLRYERFRAEIRRLLQRSTCDFAAIDFQGDGGFVLIRDSAPERISDCALELLESTRTLGGWTADAGTVVAIAQGRIDWALTHEPWVPSSGVVYLGEAVHSVATALKRLPPWHLASEQERPWGHRLVPACQPNVEQLVFRLPETK